MTGPGPYEAAESYRCGEISREELVQILTTWRYVPGEQRTAGLHDDLLNFVPGSFDEVEAAFTDDLIDLELYEIALSSCRSHGAAIGSVDSDECRDAI
ncbi:hypothetical protein [Clavibacter nebraskensis]|uniref:hypothetical protein n=1 Tax=Clavibacter nebraskensis TaxID=31963 RepID=UPI001F1DF7FF|nr:hypothetical protein [Clavibacter nebraskensis]UKF28056.1 hypothetical protein FGQ65_07360 [Clavibacter nebraskensis]UQB13932.1 hypothetical protein LIX20_000479 [Clavibacter nebraskensis]UQB16764.1 hypothetical protein LIX22_000478 [Clavibacter nebraskensis]